MGSAALGGVWVGGQAFAALIAFLLIVMCFEWARMIEGRDLTATFYVLAVASAAAVSAAAAGLFATAYAVGLVGALAAYGAARHVGAGETSIGGGPRDIAGWAAFGAFYCIGPAVALIWLRGAVENGRALTYLLFIIVWAADSAAYFAGRFIGGPRLSPLLSPAKTWSGAAAGVLAGGGAGLLGGGYIFGGGPDAIYALIGGSLGLASILGDLTESAFKRLFGVKDTSGFIPGHGGALDRLDGMIFATTAMTAVLYGHILASRP